MVLVDTSVWIDFFRGTKSPQADHLAALFNNEEDVCISGIIVTEILQGIRPDKEYKRVKKLLVELVYLPTLRETYVLAADLFRTAQTKGFTIRKTMDCLIAACAIYHKIPFLHKDADFDKLKQCSELLIYPL
tara:strand:+ start:522 stop:917 length:396 start_codon:yes stop_codon:yes gene_type:complete